MTEIKIPGTYDPDDPNNRDLDNIHWAGEVLDNLPLLKNQAFMGAMNGTIDMNEMNAVFQAGMSPQEKNVTNSCLYAMDLLFSGAIDFEMCASMMDDAFKDFKSQDSKE